jgi:hypothetical protein
MKVVINNCFGGFSLSDEAWEAYLDKCGIEYTTETDGFNFTHHRDLEGNYLGSHDVERNDPRLIEVIEEMGDAADGFCASLKIVEIPDGVEWCIEEYDGSEHIAEKHRTWW